MSERYWITGVQLGMLKVSRDWPNMLEVLRDIENKQFIGQITSGTEIAIVPIVKAMSEKPSCENCNAHDKGWLRCLDCKYDPENSGEGRDRWNPVGTPREVEKT